MRPAVKRRKSSPQIDIQTQSPLWEAQPMAAQIVHDAVLAAASELSTEGGEVSIVLTDDLTIAKLNCDWRGIDKPTNVLSFPASDHKAHEEMRLLGDIVIAYQTLARQCAEEPGPFFIQHAHLRVNGLLHLRGYKHKTERQAEEMEALERKIMSRLTMPDLYFERDLGVV